MHNFKTLKQSHILNIERSILISILFFVFLFFLFPRFPDHPSNLQSYPPPRLYLVEIPRTLQESSKKRPPPSLPSIPVASDEPDLMEDVLIQLPDNHVESGVTPVLSSGEVSRLSIIPRQILEVLPERSAGEIEGFIRLALLIGTDGQVMEYKVLENTTGQKDILTQVIKAVKKSRWEPVVIDDIRYEYWIEKSYRFDK